MVESSALIQAQRVSVFNHLRLERRLRSTLHGMRRKGLEWSVGLVIN